MLVVYYDNFLGPFSYSLIRAGELEAEIKSLSELPSLATHKKVHEYMH